MLSYGVAVIVLCCLPLNLISLNLYPNLKQGHAVAASAKSILSNCQIYVSIPKSCQLWLCSRLR